MAANRSGARFFAWWRQRGAMAAFRAPTQSTPDAPAQGQFFRWGASDLFRWGATDRAGWA